MRSRILPALLAGVSCVFLQTAAAGAQGNDSTRGYDGQALRYESYWGSAAIIRGPDGPVVGTAGWFRSFDVEKLVAISPQAKAEARVYNTNNFRGSLVASIGAAATLIGVAVTANSSNNASSPILIIGGVGALALSAQHFKMAYSALSKSLWFYNRELARQAHETPTVGRAEPPRFPLPLSPPPVTAPPREADKGKRNRHPE